MDGQGRPLPMDYRHPLGAFALARQPDAAAPVSRLRTSHPRPRGTSRGGSLLARLAETTRWGVGMVEQAVGALAAHRRATAGRLHRVNAALSRWDEYDGAQAMPA